MLIMPHSCTCITCMLVHRQGTWGFHSLCFFSLHSALAPANTCTYFRSFSLATNIRTTCRTHIEHVSHSRTLAHSTSSCASHTIIPPFVPSLIVFASGCAISASCRKAAAIRDRIEMCALNRIDWSVMPVMDPSSSWSE